MSITVAPADSGASLPGNPARWAGASASAALPRFRESFAPQSTIYDNPLSISAFGDFRRGCVCFDGYRYLDPVTGRWPSRDPIEIDGGVHLYALAENDGVNRWDLVGLLSPDYEPPMSDVLSDCEKKLAEANKQQAVVDIRKAMKDRGCKEPKASCQNCCRGSDHESPHGGFFKRKAKNSSELVICANNNVGYSGYINDIKKLVHHEWIHAWQDCSGYAGGYPTDRDGKTLELPVGDDRRCRHSVCTEIQAYANASVSPGDDAALRKIRVKNGARVSSRPHCGMGIDGLQKLDKLCEELYEKCSKPVDLDAD